MKKVRGWYSLVEPEHLTGFEMTDSEHSRMQMLTEVHEYFAPQIDQDAEMLYVFGLMADLFWFVLDDAPKWQKRSVEYRKRYRDLLPNGIDLAVFHNRGAYGEYYGKQAEIEGGY